MKKQELIRFIRKNNRFYQKAYLSFYTEEQLRAIREEIIKNKALKKGL
jgi:hypothetical protein